MVKKLFEVFGRQEVNPVENKTNYNFSHRVFRELIFTHKDSFIQKLIMASDEENEKVLKSLWDSSYEMAKSRKGYENIVKEEFKHELKQGNLEKGLLYWVIKLPEPKYSTDCKYIGILYGFEKNEIKYYTLEKSLNIFADPNSEENKNVYMLCGWDTESHLNYGFTPDCDLEGFVSLIHSNNQK